MTINGKFNVCRQGGHLTYKINCELAKLIKNRQMKLNIFILTVLLTTTFNVFSQKVKSIERECSTHSYGTVWVMKNKCPLGSDTNGYRLEVYFLKDNKTTKSDYYWYDNPFLKFSDSAKLLIIEQLLTFEDDTSKTCIHCGYNITEYVGKKNQQEKELKMGKRTKNTKK